MSNFSRAATLFALVGLAELIGCKKEAPKVVSTPQTVQTAPTVKIEDVARDVLPANASQELQECFDKVSRRSGSHGRGQEIGKHGYCMVNNDKDIPSLYVDFVATINGREETIDVSHRIKGLYGSLDDKNSNNTWFVNASVESDTGLKARSEHSSVFSMSDFNRNSNYYTTDAVTASKTSDLKSILPITKVMVDETPKLEKYTR